jgi:preprotein translocase subunit SecD
LAESEPNPNLAEINLDKSDLTFYLQDTVFLNNQDIESTDVFDWETHPKVMVTLTDKGRENFASFTAENIGKNAAILVDNKLISAPRINAAIHEGKLIIIGHFSHEDALRIAEGILPK